MAAVKIYDWDKKLMYFTQLLVNCDDDLRILGNGRSPREVTRRADFAE